MLNGLLDNVSLGLTAALTFNNLLYCTIGVTLGTFLGVIPGIGALAAISMLFPLTYHLDPMTALVMLGGIYYGTNFGGSTASILLNLPGTPSNAVTCLDGYPMAKQGRAGVALLMSAVASYVGGTFGIIVMMVISPFIVELGLSFGAPEYFSLMVLGLVAASVISAGSPIHGLAMVVLGIVFGVAGTDLYTGTERFTFGVPELTDGISLVALAMGLFGISEIIASVSSTEDGSFHKKELGLKSMLPTRDDMQRSWFPTLRGSLIGAFFGALPGTGGTVASFMSYAAEKKIAKDPSRFGKGTIEGIMGPESSNNAAEQTAFIPTLTLGIPGSATMALMLGVLMIHGILPGPSLMANHPDLFWGLIMSFWIANLLLVILNVPLIGIWIRVLMIPYHILYPAILMFVCIGVYIVNYSPFDVLMVLVFGVFGYGMRLLNFPAAPLLLGFVLGPMLEEHFRRALLISGGDFSTFVDRPLGLSFLIVSVALLLWGTWTASRPARHRKAVEKAELPSTD